jgi:hypothetical protein
MAELFYINELGQQVWTSEYLKNKKTCCKSGCLHCPYGFSLKKFGIQFKTIEDSELPQAQELMANLRTQVTDLASFPSQYRQWILLKEHLCGFFLSNHLVIKHLFLKPEFQNQGLSKEMIESYFY